MQSNKVFEVVLDRQDPMYHPGESVTGHVVMQVDQTNSSRALDLRVAWHITGEAAPPSSGSEQRVQLSAGSLEPGQVYRVPFAVELPNGPFTFRGRHFTMDWAVDAEAQMALGPKLDARAGFILTGGPTASPEAYQIGDSKAKHVGVEARESRQLITTFFGIISFIGSGAFSINLVLADPDMEPIWALFFGGLGLLLVVVGLFAAALAVRRAIVGALLGTVQVELESTRVHADDWLYLSLSLPARLVARVESLKVVLRCTERTVLHEATSEHVAFVEEHVLPRSLVVASGGDGEPLELRHRIRVPREAPPSFHATGAEVAWEVEVEVSVPGWSPQSKRRSLEVVPAREEGQAVLDVREPTERFSNAEAGVW